jgi:hypothetical protein
MDLVQGYLRLNSAYCDQLGGLRWSARDDAIDYKEGTTFCFHVQLVLLLRGFGNSRRLMHFCHFLHFLDMLRGNRLPGRANPAAEQELPRLRRAFVAGGRRLFNAGAFAAQLCRRVPPVPDPISVADVQKRLEQSASQIRWSLALYHDALTPAPAPPLTPAEFENVVVNQVRAYSDEELETWFRTGRGPVKEAAEALVPALIPPAPTTLTGALTAVLDRPRLYGVRLYIAQMVSALALPARRQVHAEIPIGGYDEVTTRGQPDQILPSQFALDEWDFFRRYAERELLYFRREEPHALCRQQLVVLLDQGVRTWGDVRLVLTAAVVALGQQAQRRCWPFLLAATSGRGQLVDPLAAYPEVLARLLGASDLSANPGLALETVLEDTPEESRDVVLLTHPRNLKEEDVRTAARRLTPSQRLFALAVDGTGHTALSEIKHGAAVPLRELQVDFRAAEPPRVAPPQQAAEPPAPWEGDVEPIAFPFWLGVNQPLAPKLFAFDQASEWLLAASTSGYLYAWRLDGERREMLPRGYRDGILLKQVEAVLGVAGGFVVVGREDKDLLAMHYDFVARKGTLHTVGLARGLQWHWGYDARHHGIVALEHHGSQKYTLDLQTGVCYSSQEVRPESPTMPAWAAGELADIRGGWLNVPDASEQHPVRPFLAVDSKSGEMALGVKNLRFNLSQRALQLPPPLTVTPLADGQPLLKGRMALEAQGCGQTLAVRTSSPGGKRPFRLELFQAPDWRFLRSYRAADSEGNFLLSPDGRYLCRLVKAWRLIVHDIAGETQVLLTREAVPSPLQHFSIGSEALILCTGKKRPLHVLRWDNNRLEIDICQTPPQPLAASLSRDIQWKEVLTPYLEYDGDRFIQASMGPFAVADQFGQVALLDSSRKLICMLVVFKDQLAIWLPDGTYYGPASLTGRPATPQALEKIARALRSAFQEGKSR